MTDPSTDSGASADADHAVPPGMPRWVKAFGVIALILIVLFVFRHMASGGFGRHGRAATVETPAAQRP